MHESVINLISCKNGFKINDTNTAFITVKYGLLNGYRLSQVDEPFDGLS